MRYDPTWDELQADAAPTWVELSRRELRARRQHKCDFCGRTIWPGEIYDRTVALEDGELATIKHCRQHVFRDEFGSFGYVP